MEAYPQDYVSHNLPLVFLAGLGSSSDSRLPHEAPESSHGLLQEGGIPVKTDIPPAAGSTAEDLLKLLLSADARHAPWNGRNDAGRPGGAGLWLKRVGRSYILPPRKAKPPPSSPSLGPSFHGSRGSPPPAPVLHSPLSPLTPSSPTFPDGVITPLWISKHQRILPAAIIHFYPFTADPNVSSLRDNQLKTDINNIRSTLSSTNYKCRFVAVLICEEGGDLGDLDERLASIRRATSSESKSSLLFLSPEATSVELKEFSKTLLSSLQPSCVEYYRDLSKHARRKRNRGSIPPPTAPPTTGTSQTLPLQGWNIRYEFKLGIFAEFRQEMDAALRNYESAYEGLFGPDVFESIASCSPRFSDTRMLADVVAIRIIRCLLWNGQTTSAARAWTNHRSRIQDLIDRREKGTNNYGWEAWEARWSKVMAEIIELVEIPILATPETEDSSMSSTGSIYALPEKAIPIGERILPWELLHHEGYWYNRSMKHTLFRRFLAEQMPEEDRTSPGQSPASQIANKSYLYDTYLAPDPHLEFPLSGNSGFDHSHLVLDTLQSSINQFSRRQQTRTVERLRLDKAKEHMLVGSWTEASSLLRPLWQNLSARRAGWWNLVEEIGWTLRQCALRTVDGESVLRVDWELLNRVFTRRPGWRYDFRNSLKDIHSAKPKPAVVLKSEDVASCVTASFAFGRSEGNVGEPLRSQLVIESHAHSGSSAIVLSEVKIVFEGSLRPVRLLSDDNPESSTPEKAPKHQILGVNLRDSANSADLSSSPQSPTGGLASLIGVTDLSFLPGQVKAYNLTNIPREAGEVKVASVTLMMEEETFSLAYVLGPREGNMGIWWEQRKHGPSRKRIGMDRETSTAKILPKPPKLRIEIPSLREHYYTDETVALDVEIINEEDKSAEVAVEIRLFGRSESPAKLSWLSDNDGQIEDVEAAVEEESVGEATAFLPRRPVGSLASSARSKLGLLVSETTNPLDYELEISTLYHLASDPETPIIKTLTVDLTFIRPFEANYEFLPRLHPDPWPDFFHVEEERDDTPSAENTPSNLKPYGLQQRWCLTSKLVSFAMEPLIIETLSLAILSINGEATCHISPEVCKSTSSSSPSFSEIGPEELRESEFSLDVQKLRLEDRRSASLNLALEIRWRRKDSPPSAATTTSSLAIPRFLVPMGEPRVLASSTTTPASSSLPGLIHLDYTLENPSMHFLTFNLTMEASEEFIFSGAKATSLQLVPLSRQTVRYNLFAAKRGEVGGKGVWITPQLVVVDVYFNKTLRVLPAAGVEGMMRSDKKGVGVWVGG